MSSFHTSSWIKQNRLESEKSPRSCAQTSFQNTFCFLYSLKLRGEIRKHRGKMPCSRPLSLYRDPPSSFHESMWSFFTSSWSKQKRVETEKSPRFCAQTSFQNTFSVLTSWWDHATMRLCSKHSRRLGVVHVVLPASIFIVMTITRWTVQSFKKSAHELSFAVAFVYEIYNLFTWFKTKIICKSLQAASSDRT